jgi:hypothetical protein
MNKEVIRIEKTKVKPDLFGQLDQLNKKYEDKFLNEIHPLIKKYHDFTGKDFRFEIPKQVIIDWNGSHYWVVDEDIFTGEKSSGIWYEKTSHDCLGRPFGNERNGWFYLTARLCCKYEKDIKTQIEGELMELMK